ncbi:MAG TPA: ATP-binding protein [Thermodesulfobacteriota bacterium]|nr:ATP-binding protein [Thermodesulfobacteriota bacterium]
MNGKLHSYIPRLRESDIKASLEEVPVTAILGPRQCGKTTLARHIAANRAPDNVIHLDLERAADQRKIVDAEWFLSRQAGKLVILDEIQRSPGLFMTLRVLADDPDHRYSFLVLGSASPELLRQSSESLAGRIRYHELTPLLWQECAAAGMKDRERHWVRGGFPGSLLATSETSSTAWRESFSRTFLEKDVVYLGVGASPEMLGRLWRMLAHQHGQLLNTARLGQALGVSHTTARKYIGILTQNFMVRVLEPFKVNLGKRLVKSPKVYLRDTGVLHSLLEIEGMDDLLGHPVVGASWEGWCIEQICAALPGWRASFVRTSNGEEVDLLMERGRQRLAFEFKASTAPQLTRGCATMLRDTAPDHAWVVCPIAKGWDLRDNVTVASIDEVLAAIIK